jgi:hypothetical protein
VALDVRIVVSALDSVTPINARTNDRMVMCNSLLAAAAARRHANHNHPHTRHDRKHIRKAENRMGDVGVTKVRGRAGRKPANNAEAGSFGAGCLEQRIAVGSR